MALRLWIGFALALLISTAPGAASEAESARSAYKAFLKRFWAGTHLAIYNGNEITKAASGPRRETPPQQGWLWQYAQAWNVLYAYAKTAPATDADKADASAKLAREWAWVKAGWPKLGTSVDICGAVEGTYAQAMDDVTWSASGLVQLYDVTGDAVALQGAANLLACGYERWGVKETGGGLRYCDASDSANCAPPLRDYKVSFAGQFALAMLECAERGCAASGMTREQMTANARKIADWGNSVLLRSVSVCPQPDALYWMDAFQRGDATAVGEDGCARPNQIAPGGSVTQLSNNLSFAALNAKLQTLYGGSYLTKARNTAESILAKERDPNGVLVNDRDARTALYGLYPFLAYVYPQLGASQKAAWEKALRATAEAVSRGALRPDWDAAWNQAWAKLSPDQIEVAAQQALVVILARNFAF